MPRTWEEIERSIDRQIEYLAWVEFWTNRVPARLYGGYRDDPEWKGKIFPMDN